MDRQPSPQHLATCALFGGLSEPCCQQLLDRLEQREVAADAVVYREGDIARELYIVESGRLEVFKPSVAPDVIMFEIGGGEFFGDLSFIDMQPRSMTVRAAEPSIVWQLEYSVLHDAYVSDLKCYTLVVMNIAREMSRRLRRADRARVIDRMSAQLFERATGARRAFGEVISRIGLRGITAASGCASR